VHWRRNSSVCSGVVRPVKVGQLPQFTVVKPLATGLIGGLKVTDQLNFIWKMFVAMSLFNCWLCNPLICKWCTGLFPKIPPKMHQISPFSAQKSKKILVKGPAPSPDLFSCGHTHPSEPRSSRLRRSTSAPRPMGHLPRVFLWRPSDASSVWYNKDKFLYRLLFTDMY